MQKNFFGENASHQTLSYTSMPELTIELSWYAITDLGHRREVNEDSIVLNPSLFAVADGMGGHEGGDRASQAVASNLSQIDMRTGAIRQSINEALVEAVAEITGGVIDEELGAGTTVTGVTFGNYRQAPTWDVFNIGDSRVYQFFQGHLTQITADHSIVQHLIDTGAITEEEAEVHPHANIITRAVGFNEAPIPDYYRLAIIPGQRLLITSDGLMKELTDTGIRHFLQESETVREAAENLVHQALSNSGRDNISVVVIDVHAVGDDRNGGDQAAVPQALKDDPFDDLNDTEEVQTVEN